MICVIGEVSVKLTFTYFIQFISKGQHKIALQYCGGLFYKMIA